MAPCTNTTLSPSRVVAVSLDPWGGCAEALPEGAEVREYWGDEASLIDLHARAVRAGAETHGLSPADAVLVLLAPHVDDHVLRTASLLATRLGWPESRTRLVSPKDDFELPPGAQALVHDLRMPWMREAVDALPGLLEDARRTSPPPMERMVTVLAALVRRGRHPLAAQAPSLYAWVRTPRREMLRQFVMVGVSIRGALGSGAGPAFRYSAPDAFRALKRPHGEVLGVLAGLRGDAIEEAFVWNTCNRMELYAWVNVDARDERMLAAMRRAGRALLGEAAEGANLISGNRAFQHLVRTAAGLNSTLAGDAEVLDQLDAARRMAEHAGMAGVRTTSLLKEAGATVARVREQTAWGGFAHRYCDVALGRLAREIGGAARGRCIIIGGSTTSASVLEALNEQFKTPRQNLTLVYRGQRSGILTSRLHAAAADGQILNVESYADNAVMEAIAGADAVFLAGDHREPVVSGRRLVKHRDVASRPLLVVDFNTLGSTEGLERLEGVRLIDAARLEMEVSRFNREILGSEPFQAALGGAEALIAERTGVRIAVRREHRCTLAGSRQNTTSTAERFWREEVAR